MKPQKKWIENHFNVLKKNVVPTLFKNCNHSVEPTGVRYLLHLNLEWYACHVKNKWRLKLSIEKRKLLPLKEMN